MSMGRNELWIVRTFLKLLCNSFYRNTRNIQQGHGWFCGAGVHFEPVVEGNKCDKYAVLFRGEGVDICIGQSRFIAMKIVDESIESRSFSSPHRQQHRKSSRMAMFFAMRKEQVSVAASTNFG